MANVKATFSLKDDDVNKIKEAIKDCGEYSEKVINDYLHNVGGENIAKSITNFLPRSNRNKVHAKDKKWNKQNNYNLSVSIENASKFYFDKSSKDLTIAEAALLTGIPKSPSYYSPFVNFDLAKKRQVNFKSDNNSIAFNIMNDISIHKSKLTFF